MKILVVGDIAFRESCSKLLADETISGDIRTCSSMDGVLERSGEMAAPAVLIVDLRQPGTLTGLSNYKKSRPGTYAIAVAGQAQEKLLEEAFFAGYDDFIFSPINECELRARVKKAIHRQESIFSLEREEGPKLGAFYTAVRTIANIFLAVLLVIFSFFLVQSKLSGGVPSIAGYRVYIVLSGSMEPAFNTGSIVFVRPADPGEIQPGDVITFTGTGGGNLLTTHRVVEIKQENGLEFITRGDANNVNDPRPVPAENLIGKVHGSAPYLGYLLGFARTRKGLLFLVFIPGLLVIIFELRNIFRYAAAKVRVEAKPADSPLT